jgi:hypothetical protein
VSRGLVATIQVRLFCITDKWKGAVKAAPILKNVIERIIRPSRIKQFPYMDKPGEVFRPIFKEPISGS